jgi:hypothetical protein
LIRFVFLFFFVFSVLIYLYLDFHPTILYFFLYRLASGSCTFDAFAAWAIQLPTHPAAHYPPNHLKTSWISFFFPNHFFNHLYSLYIICWLFCCRFGNEICFSYVCVVDAGQSFFFFFFLSFYLSVLSRLLVEREETFFRGSYKYNGGGF